MAELIPAGTPISILADYGLADNLIDALVGAEVGTVEKLGSLTPEELEQLPGVGEESIQSLYNAINGFYAQFEAPLETPATDEVEGVEASVAAENVVSVEAEAESETEAVAADVEGAVDEAVVETVIENNDEVSPEAAPESSDSDKP
jgi:N utilization substance protein A